jgi:anti-sigma regulatory factor (Ser/Thr protein kinase)
VITQEPSLRLPPKPISVRRARQHVRAALLQAGHQDWVDDAAVAVSELVTNVIAHARTDCEVSVSVASESARISVRDFSGALPAHRQVAQYATTGRRLPLVQALAAGFGVEVLDSGGKEIWFLLDKTESPDPGRTQSCTLV